MEREFQCMDSIQWLTQKRQSVKIILMTVTEDNRRPRPGPENIPYHSGPSR